MNLADRLRKFSLRYYPLRLAVLSAMFLAIVLLAVLALLQGAFEGLVRGIRNTWWDIRERTAGLGVHFTRAGFKADRQAEGLS